MLWLVTLLGVTARVSWLVCANTAGVVAASASATAAVIVIFDTYSSSVWDCDIAQTASFTRQFP
jgi:hypothetical protein